MSNALSIVIAAALIVLVIARRLAGEPLRSRRLIILPIIVAVFGASAVTRLHQVRALDVGVLVAEAGLAVALGAVRGLTVHVYVRDGHLWQRYRPLTVAVWVVSIVVRFAIIAGAYAIGADHTVVQAGLLLVLGCTLIGEAAVVGLRAARLGAPFAPQRWDRTRLGG